MRHWTGCAIAAAALLAGCGSQSAEPGEKKRAIRISVDDAARIVLPGKIDPPEARWQHADDAPLAEYGVPEEKPFLRFACKDGDIAVTRLAPDRKGAKAMLALVGYRGILRLPVENDGEVWKGTLSADDRRWKAVTGGPFYATVAGGGKVITAGPGPARDLINRCEKKKDKVEAKTST